MEQNSAGGNGLYYDLTKKTKEEFSGGTEDDGGNALEKSRKFSSFIESYITKLLERVACSRILDIAYANARNHLHHLESKHFISGPDDVQSPDIEHTAPQHR